jgi:predicted RNA binding protein YcfA (HicA-like mRNA interferase family)
MGRLGGFSYREVARKLAALGFSIHRQAKGSHEIWKHHPKLELSSLYTNSQVTRHTRMDAGIQCHGW